LVLAYSKTRRDNDTAIDQAAYAASSVKEQVSTIHHPMAQFKSPFDTDTLPAGHGDVYLALLSPDKQSLSNVKFQYPLKLIAPDPHVTGDEKHVTVIFLLTYGGGLVGGDKIQLKVELEDHTRLVLLTQGSTKIFKSPARGVISGQILDVKIGAGAALCYLPDPTQPFAESVYEQKQTFYVDQSGSSSLLMLDWVTEGRKARGESWTLWGWKGRNEVRAFDQSGKGRLLLRDAVTLTDLAVSGTGLAEKTDKLGIFGTLIVYGPVFQHLGQYIMDHFKSQPRLGAKDFSRDAKPDAQQQADGLLWTAAQVRGFVLVKFGARELDGARRWLGDVLKHEGTVERHFGHQALLCLR
jgi:urease accessory protein